MTITQINQHYQITIPPEIRELLNLEIGKKLEIRVEAGKIILFPQDYQKLHDDYTLDELLGEEIEMNEEINWGKPEGEEFL
ncbi:MAG TPA: AbrB/MazE/SpoVT family DNA-binding domain-containing protein [Allocoleopsis sp.]